MCRGAGPAFFFFFLTVFGAYIVLVFVFCFRRVLFVESFGEQCFFCVSELSIRCSKQNGRKFDSAGIFAIGYSFLKILGELAGVADAER